jgi:uncharacterized protein (DUF58 family)
VVRRIFLRVQLGTTFARTAFIGMIFVWARLFLQLALALLLLFLILLLTLLLLAVLLGMGMRLRLRPPLRLRAPLRMLGEGRRQQQKRCQTARDSGPSQHVLILRARLVKVEVQLAKSLTTKGTKVHQGEALG